MPSTDESPRTNSVLTKVWCDYKRWANTSRLLKNSQDKARSLTLWFGGIGAALATLSSQVTDSFCSSFTALTGSALIALAGYLGRELLNPQSETDWARCRILAEALQRQVWFALMKVPPYAESDAGKKLAERAQKLVRTVKLSQAPISSQDIPPLPMVTTIDDYIKLRLLDQSNWYRQKAAEMQSEQLLWRRISLGLGAAAILLSGVIGHFYAFATAWVPVITSASAAVMTIVQARRLQTQVPVYQQTADQLEFVLAQWEDGDRAAPLALVQEAEDIMSKENESWRSEWLAKAADQKSVKVTTTSS